MNTQVLNHTDNLHIFIIKQKLVIIFTINWSQTHDFNLWNFMFIFLYNIRFIINYN